MPETSKREYDYNGWFEVKDNPLAKAGVFSYLGSSLGEAGRLLGCDPDKMYDVFRPPEELADPECIASFRLVPWIDDHSDGMMGDPDKGLVAADEKGIHGVTGENIYFNPDDNTLYGNIKLFSETLADLIESGKRELSLGYRACYVMRSGTFEGKPFAIVQCKIRGNHLASVDDGRMGVEVAVLDNEDLPKMDETKEMSLEDAILAFQKLVPLIQTLIAAKDGEAAPAAEVVPAEEPVVEPLVDADGTIISTEDADDDVKQPGVATADEDDDKKDKVPAVATADEDDKKEAKGEGMDSRDVMRRVANLETNTVRAVLAHVKSRDRLADQIAAHVGTFDHSDMTVSDVVKYGMGKLGVKAPKGEELATLRGYLQAAPNPASVRTVQGTGMDSAPTSGAIRKYINGGK